MKYFLSTALSLAAALSLGAQNLNIAYVDLPTAETQLAALTAQNDGLNTEISLWKQQQTDLQSAITAVRSSLVEIGPVIETLKAKNRDFHALKADIKDRGLKAEAESSLERNKSVLAKLEARQAELEAELVRNQVSLAALPPMIQTNEAKIQANNDSMVLIRAAIEKTKNQHQGLQDSIQGVDSLEAEAAKVLK